MFAKIIFFALAVSFAYAGPQNIFRPCALNDYKCLGDNFAANSRCSRRLTGPIPSEYVVDEFKFETPYFNSSVIDRNTIVRNHDKCYVSEFFKKKIFDIVAYKDMAEVDNEGGSTEWFSTVDFNCPVDNVINDFARKNSVNVKSDTSVITIDCPGLEIQAQRTVIHHLSALEDEYFYYNSWASYPLVRVTMNIKHADSMQVCSAYAFADVTQLPNFFLDPADKPTEDFLSTNLPFLDIFERESFMYRAGPGIKLFINSYICNFGCVY